MAFNVKLGTFSKKVASTARPDTSAWLSVNAVWKQDKDIDAPTLTLYLPDLTGYPQWNYMYIPEVSSFYWITDVISVRSNVWEVSAVMDYLATWRDTIMQTSAYILYGSNEDASAPERRIQDDRQSISCVPQVTTGTADITQGAIDAEEGTYVISAVGNNGGVANYAILASTLHDLIDTLHGTVTKDLDELTELVDVLKYNTRQTVIQGSAISAIRSCTWMPFDRTLYTPMGAFQDIYLGDYDTGLTGTVLSQNSIVVKTTSIPIPWPTDDWKRMNCQISLYLPFFGTVGVPLAQCNNASTIEVTLSIELVTGGLSIRVECGDYTVYTGSTEVGVSYAIGSSNITPMQSFQGFMQAVGGSINAGSGMIKAGSGILESIGARKPIFTAALEGIVSAAGSVVSGASQHAAGVAQAITPVISCIGSMGGSSAVGQSLQAKLTLLYYEPVDDVGFQAMYGHPVLQVGTPVLGYCQTQGFNLSAPARAAEIQAVNAAMDAGVFIE